MTDEVPLSSEITEEVMLMSEDSLYSTPLFTEERSCLPEELKSERIEGELVEVVDVMEMVNPQKDKHEFSPMKPSEPESLEGTLDNLVDQFMSLNLDLHSKQPEDITMNTLE
jgi:hypothetical protein